MLALAMVEIKIVTFVQVPRRHVYRFIRDRVLEMSKSLDNMDDSKLEQIDLEGSNRYELTEDIENEKIVAQTKLKTVMRKKLIVLTYEFKDSDYRSTEVRLTYSGFGKNSGKNVLQVSLESSLKMLESIYANIMEALEDGSTGS